MLKLLIKPLKLSILVLILGISSAHTISAQGIEFVQGTWEEILGKARQERKLVFVDAFTTWCPPCKAMNRNTFPKPEVGEFFGEHFINYKFDMEKGEGPAFGSKYGVIAYPTMFFINFNGDVVHKIMGYHGPKELVAEGRAALHPSKNLAIIELEYQSGNRAPNIILEYALHQKKAKKDYRSYADEYFATQEEKDLLTRENWKAIQELSYSIRGPEYEYLIKKQKKFIKRYGARAVLSKIYEVMKSSALESGLTGNPAKYAAALEIAENDLKDDGQTANRLKMTYTEARKNWEAYAERAIFHYENYPISQPKELDHSANLFYRHIDDPAQLEIALRWTQQSIAMENEAYNNQTRAKILMKLGRFTEALRSANTALQLAQLKEQDTRRLEALIEKIQQKLG